MQITAKNHDHVTPDARITPDRRDPIPRFGWACVAVCALLALAVENVQHRDAIVELKERQAVEVAAQVAAQVAEILAKKNKPDPGYCSEYRIHMERWTLTFCLKKPVKV